MWTPVTTVSALALLVAPYLSAEPEARPAATTQNTPALSWRLEARAGVGLSNPARREALRRETRPVGDAAGLRAASRLAARQALDEEDQGWFAFVAPEGDPSDPASAFDLRGLNEPVAGAGGFIGVRGSQFIHSDTGEPIRFWGVTGPPGYLRDPAALRWAAPD